MSTKQIKKLVFAMILIVCLAYGAFWLLLRPSGLDKKTATDHFDKHRTSYENVAEFLVANKYTTNITGYLTIDNHYGIVGDDSNEYKRFAKGVDDLMTGISLDAISAEGTVVRFKQQKEGGLWNKEHIEIVYSKGTEPAGTTPLGPVNWYYEIVKD